MMENDKLRAFFQQHKQEIVDDGFSERVGKEVRRLDTPTWHFYILAGALSIAVIILIFMGVFQYLPDFLTSTVVKLLSFSFSPRTLIISPYFYMALMAILLPLFLWRWGREGA